MSMQTVEIDIKKAKSPSDVLRIMARENIRKGDKIRVRLSKEEVLLALGVLLLIGLGLAMHFKRKRKYADGVLQNIFEEFENPGELEQHLEKKYGVELELNYEAEVDEEREVYFLEGWKHFGDAYGKDEPEYTAADIKEPNPDYFF